MLTKRIIPCLDIQNGRTVKGVHFEHLRDAGDPVELAQHYSETGADEIVFLDITATNERRKTLTALVRRVAKQINIPFTVGGGIASEEDVSIMLDNGADKISINTAAFKTPALIDQLANRFGSQCVVVAMDVKYETVDGKPDWYIHLNGGRITTSTRAVDWAKEAVQRGAGEILLTSMNNDGTENGFALEITSQVSEAVNVPVIASGGAGTMEHFMEVLTIGKADAALAASVFHFNQISIEGLKNYLRNEKIAVRN
jgi:imidazole glycerol-phosphate synthase subunit HisF